MSVPVLLAVAFGAFFIGFGAGLAVGRKREVALRRALATRTREAGERVIAFSDTVALPRGSLTPDPRATDESDS
ncbi:MAG: hypothetical protein AAGH15_21260 [Myxococcota bacterium]